MTRKAFCIMSGGLDSGLAAYEAVNNFGCENVKAIFFDWGQKAINEELAAVKSICNALNIELLKKIIVQLNEWDTSSISQNFNGIIKEDSIAVSERNLVFLSLAASYARTKGGGELYVGFNASDNGFDTKDEFVNKLNMLFEFENDALKGIDPCSIKDTNIKVIAPLLGCEKTTIIRKMKEIGLYDMAYSCYYANGPCNKCLACMNRDKYTRGL
jgi:7-cyano-7-deazaguanine synthase